MAGPDEERTKALDAYRAELIKSREWEAKLKALRLEIKELVKDFDRTEDNIKALQSVGQIIGEVLKQLDEERCTYYPTCPPSPAIPPPPFYTKLTFEEQSSSRRPPGLDTSSAADPRSTGRSLSRARAWRST